MLKGISLNEKVTNLIPSMGLVSFMSRSFFHRLLKIFEHKSTESLSKYKPNFLFKLQA